MNELYSTLFGVLFVSVFVWFFLVFRLFKLLETEHPEKYEAMGKPTLFWNHSPKTSWELMKFLFKREYASLGSSKLSFLGNVMLIFIALYFVGFFFLSFGVSVGNAP
jgi:hypothetical protein